MVQLTIVSPVIWDAITLIMTSWQWQCFHEMSFKTSAIRCWWTDSLDNAVIIHYGNHKCLHWNHKCFYHLPCTGRSRNNRLLAKCYHEIKGNYCEYPPTGYTKYIMIWSVLILYNLRCKTTGLIFIIHHQAIHKQVTRTKCDDLFMEPNSYDPTR